MTSIPQRAYSALEEWLNSVSHGLACIAAIIGLVFMLMRAETTVSIAASAIYGSTLIFMFLASTIYHGVTHQDAKGVLKLFDHSAIYLLIAGTYTPLTVVAVGGTTGIVATTVIWLMAITGVTFKLVARHRFPKVSVITYLIMGWTALAIIYPLYQSLPTPSFWLIVAGGVCFSLGVFFYVAKSKPYTHAIWHLFVIAGCSCHYFSIYYYVV